MHSTMIYGVIALAASSAYARALPSFEKRHAYGTEGSCAPQPLGSGPVTNQPDDADAFRANPVYDSMAQAAATPEGWTVAYQGLKAASSTGGYLGWEELTSYDVDYCASKCSGFWPGCTSFNIYLERNPTVDPAANCSNPSSTTRVKCSFWSQSLSGLDATNDGQYCSDFHIVIAGSNGYNALAQETTTTTTTASTTTTDVAVSTTSVTADTTSVADAMTTSATTSVADPVTTSTTTSVAAPVTTSATTSVAAPVTTSTTTSVAAPVITSATTSVAAPVTTSASAPATTSVTTSVRASTTTSVATPVTTSVRAPVTTSVATAQTTTSAKATTTTTTTSARAPVTTSVTTLQTTSTKATTTTFKSTTMATTTRTTTQSPSPSGSISKCPTAELFYRAADGSTWALCRGTDYRGTTVQMIKNVASDSACAELCARAGNECVKSVYEPQCDICHLKGSPLTWVVDPKYDAIRQLTA